MKTSEKVRLAETLSQMPLRAKTAVQKAEQEALDEAMTTFLRNSSGTFTPRDLRAMDNPFARRHGEALLPPEIINEQSGDFKRNFNMAPVEIHDAGTRGQVTNASESAHWLATGGKGNSKMVERPVVDAVAREIRAARAKRTQSAYRQALKEATGC